MNNLNVRQVEVSDHAITRAKQRTSWANMKKEQVIGNIRALLKRSEEICETVDEDGKPAILFAVERVAIYLTLDYKTVITIIRHEQVTYMPIKSKLLELHKKEIKKLERREKARIRRLEDLTIDCNVEIAELKRRIHRTKSESVKKACEARISAIRATIKEYKHEIKSIQDEKRQASRSLVAVI
ncbi:hypothetical protein [Halalkalibacter oceani]|uniref:hypothetical protein n=1 Tax=Halalkalibacter oceani TaxID=1653776 RepID=UPI003399DBDB